MSARARIPSARVRFALTYPRLAGVWRKYRELTQVRRRRYIGNLHLVATTLRDPRLAGAAIVECGTWKGGMSCGLLAAAPGARAFHFFDSFEGLPPAREIDGNRAIEWQRDTQGPQYLENNRADAGAFEALVRKAARADQEVNIHKGWFAETLPLFPRERPIAVLCLDGDWYDSTMTCLENLFDHVLPGGIVIIDDYLDWDGCTRAVHDFLSARKSAEGIQQARFGGVYNIVKLPAGEFVGPETRDKVARH